MSPDIDSALARLVKLAVISPSDVSAERDVLETVVAGLDREFIAAQPPLALRLWRWERNARPGPHPRGPQGLIDDLMDIAEADIVVAIFWRRFGTPTGVAQSGTEHELRRAWAAWDQRRRPEVLVYFCDRTPSPTADDLEQSQRVDALRAEATNRQICAAYTDVLQFERLVREHLIQAISAMDKPARRGEMPRVMESLLGRVLLRVERGDARFDGVGGDTRSREVRLPGAVIGSAPEADVRVSGPAVDGKVSRLHLVVATSGRQWTIADWGSANGTFEVDTKDGSWRTMPSRVPVPLEDGMLLRLGPELVLRLEIVKPALTGSMTPVLRGPDSRQQRIRPAELEQFAIALVERRRVKPDDRAMSSAARLARALSLEPKAAKRCLRELRELAPVASCLVGKGPEQLAVALELAFPYLLGMLPRASSPISPADSGVPRRPGQIA